MDRGKDTKIAGRPLDTAGAPREARELDAGAVADYLRRHPDFLAAHPDLIPALTPPELRRGEGVVDMQHFMLQRLRHDLARRSVTWCTGDSSSHASGS